MQQAALLPGIKVDTVLQQCLDADISNFLVEENKKQRTAHEGARLWPRDRMAAGKLWCPLQWHALKSLGCPQSEPDDYARRLFLRGDQCEAWLIPQMTRLVSHLQSDLVCEEQKPVTYRQVGGYIDLMIGTMPWEIKSVKNSKYSRIVKAGQPDRGHLLQGCLYALATGSPTYGVIYVAADDFRVQPYTVDTAFIQPELDLIIDKFDTWYDVCHQADQFVPMVPKFYPGETWHNNPKYNAYPTWMGLTEDERAIKLAKEIASWK